MESLWQQIISTNSATSNIASAYLYNVMGALGGYAPDSAPNLSNEGVIAANWTNAVELAGLTSVFQRSNACSVGSIALHDDLGNPITALVGASSGTNGTYALATLGNIEYFDGTGSVRTANASIILNPSSHATLTGNVGDLNGQGTVSVGSQEITGAGVILNGKQNTWVDPQGTTYSLGGLNGNGSGILTISGGLAGTGSIVIDDFNLSAAETSVGYLGIKLPEQTAVEAGSPQPNPFAGGSQALASGSLSPHGGSSFTSYASASSPVDSLTMDSGSLFTAYASASTSAGQRMTLTLSGGTAADYAVSTGSGLLSFANGSITVTIPAGQDDASFALVNVADPGTNQALQLTSSVVDASGVTVTSAPLAFNYTDVSNPTVINSVPGSSGIMGDSGSDLIYTTGATTFFLIRNLPQLAHVMS